MLKKELQQIGLQEKEAQVYVASLELGQGTVQQIAIKAGLKRPTTYVIIEDLMNRGLISSFYEGKKQFFVAENPKHLMDLLRHEIEEIEARKTHLSRILPQLQSLNNRHHDKPVVKYYEGKEGILTMVGEHTKANKGQEACSAYSRDLVDSFVTKEELDVILKARIDHKLSVKTIYTYSKGDLADLPRTERVRLEEDEFPISCDIAIFNDRIRIASLKDRLIGVVIEDKEMAKSFRVIFELAWKYVNLKKSSNK